MEKVLKLDKKETNEEGNKETVGDYIFLDQNIMELGSYETIRSDVRGKINKGHRHFDKFWEATFLDWVLPRSQPFLVLG